MAVLIPVSLYFFDLKVVNLEGYETGFNEPSPGEMFGLGSLVPRTLAGVKALEASS